MGTDIHGFRVTLASPCPVAWPAMSGSDRARICALCQKRVYDLTQLTRAEVLALVGARDAVCVEFFVREDGTVLTADCPWGERRVRRAQRWARMRLGALGVALASALGALLLPPQPSTARLSCMNDVPKPDPPSVLRPLTAPPRGQPWGNGMSRGLAFPEAQIERWVKGGPAAVHTPAGRGSRHR